MNSSFSILVPCADFCFISLFFLFRTKVKGGRGKKGGAAGADVAFKKITVRYTGQKLHEKGVILEVEGLPQHQSVVQIHCTQQNCKVFVVADLEMLHLKSLLLVWEPLKFQPNSWECRWKRLNWYSRYIQILVFILKHFSVFNFLQDLLQLQYEGLAVMKMFGRAKINVNLLIYLINKKFYGT